MFRRGWCARRSWYAGGACVEGKAGLLCDGARWGCCAVWILGLVCSAIRCAGLWCADGAGLRVELGVAAVWMGPEFSIRCVEEMAIISASMELVYKGGGVNHQCGRAGRRGGYVSRAGGLTGYASFLWGCFC